MPKKPSHGHASKNTEFCNTFPPDSRHSRAVAALPGRANNGQNVAFKGPKVQSDQVPRRRLQEQ
jgi:hypothetical protein